MQFSLYMWSRQEIVSYTSAFHYLFWLLHPSIWSLYLYWVVLVSGISRRGGVEVQLVSHQELLTSYFHHAGPSECLIQLQNIRLKRGSFLPLFFKSLKNLFLGYKIHPSFFFFSLFVLFNPSLLSSFQFALFALTLLLFCSSFSLFVFFVFTLFSLAFLLSSSSLFAAFFLLLLAAILPFVWLSYLPKFCSQLSF